MENKTLEEHGVEFQGNETLEEHGNETEEFPLEFQCFVCLDLLYKPVVLACGHISCFWCVFKAMDSLQESHCPVCRHPYNHFPCICQLLHFVLLKLYPEAYKRREKLVMEEEKEVGFFSPQFDDHLSGSNTTKELNIHSTSLHSAFSPQTKLHPETCSIRDQVPSLLMDSSEIIVPDKDQITIQENSSLGNDLQPGSCKQVTIADLLCAACKNLLFRPVVLNCGHVYCESCIINLVDGIPRCQLCQSMHPYGFPKVCLVMEHFLEEQFSEIYVQRREAVLIQADCQHGSSSTCSTKAQQNAAHSSSTAARDYSSWWSHPGPKIHFGVGCDSCGMCPITGERYKCKDCSEKIGFDLCEVCYNTPSKFPGRFNQQHTSEHEFEIVPPIDVHNILSTLQLVEAGEDDSDASEDQGDASPATTLEDQEGFTFSEVSSIRASNSKVVCCHFSSDGKLLASAGHDKKVVLWNMETLQSESTPEEHTRIITDVRFQPNSSQLATSSFDTTVRLWDAADPSYCVKTYKGHTSHVMSLDFHPKKTDLFCSCDGNNEIRFWNINQYSCTHISKGGASQVRFQPRIGHLLAAAAENVVSIFDVDTDKQTLSLQGHAAEVHSLCWDTNGDYLASVSLDSVRVWSLTSGECIHDLSLSGNKFHSCTFHPSYSTLLVIGGYQSLELWNMVENKYMTIPAHECVISALAQSPVTGMVASTSHDKSVKIWK